LKLLQQRGRSGSIVSHIVAASPFKGANIAMQTAHNRRQGAR